VRSETGHNPRGRRVPPQTLRGGLFATLWWVVTEGDLASWVVGAPTVIAATATSLALSPAFRWRVRTGGCLRLLGFFLRESWRGGVDVAWRAFHGSVVYFR
jgi:multicomponent Na+:H+ antiporter subunit E